MPCFVFSAFACTLAIGQPSSQTVPGGRVYQVNVRDSTYRFDRATYSIFIPDGITKVRGLFIHQHGCTMEGIGASTGFDLQYQAFARKWGLAVVGPDLYPRVKSSCRDWINPEDGSGPALFQALDTVGELSGHPELTKAPFLLWGHSGGGYWVLAMLNLFPERVIAALCYSPAFDPQFQYAVAVANVPVMIRHAAANDFNSPGVDCWATAKNTFSLLRSIGGQVSLASNPDQNHNLSFVRYMTIPFFESVLSRRLPTDGTDMLQNIDEDKGWLCGTLTRGHPSIHNASTFTGNKRAMSWLPDSACAAKFAEYIMTGTIRDVTPPPAPELLDLQRQGDSLKLTWTALADIESGIRCFNIYINERMIERFPSDRDFQEFSTNGDNACPVNPPEMTFKLIKRHLRKNDVIGITTVNHFGLESPKVGISKGGLKRRYFGH